MIQTVKSLGRIRDIKGYTLAATDGEIGSINDFYIDSEDWSIRYVVVDTGAWMSDRLVIISPESLGQPDTEKHVFPVSLSKDQVENSPAIDIEEQLTYSYLAGLHKYYLWPSYWGASWGQGPAFPGGSALIPAPLLEQDVLKDEIASDKSHPQELVDIPPKLKSAMEIIGSDIHAQDGSIGHVEDLITDESEWKIRYIAVDTSNWWFGKHVLILPKIVEHVDAESHRLRVNATKERIKDAPVLKPHEIPSRDLELAVYNVSGEPPYWI